MRFEDFNPDEQMTLVLAFTCVPTSILRGLEGDKIRCLYTELADAAKAKEMPNDA